MLTMSSNLSPLRILLAAGAIVVIFACLVLPPIGRRPPSRDARVVVEINQLESAVAAFKARFGVEPPSRIILHEQPTLSPYNLDGIGAHARIEQRTVAYFGRIWPDFPVLTCETGPRNEEAAVQPWVDFNSNGKVEDELDLDGSECLVFFLGGMTRRNLPCGFDRDPHNPFGAGANRIGPFFEFTDINRLIDRDGDGFLEWIDSIPGQTSPFLYFSSYDGAGYNFSVDRETADNGTFQPYYRDGDPLKDRKNVNWYKLSSCQIISPGYDAKPGTGGLFVFDDRERLSADDGDNYTNFSSGRLRPK
jgi:hypothetical protein